MQAAITLPATSAKLARKGFLTHVKRWVLLNFVHDTSYFQNQPDRKWLKEKLFPKLTNLRNCRVLFVGCQHYTYADLKVFDKSIDLVSVDYSDLNAIWGAKQHLVADIMEIDKLVEPASFDLVLLNGIFGHGVNTPEDQEKTYQALYNIMKPDSLLLVGWNFDLSQDPIKLPACERLFYRSTFEDLPERSGFEDTTHVFDFLRVKPAIEVA